jgi:hypothetical protein
LLAPKLSGSHRFKVSKVLKAKSARKVRLALRASKAFKVRLVRMALPARKA